jgi:hypothetical protein
VLPGSYTVKLTANGKIYSQSLTVKMDPRVKITPAALRIHHTLAMQAYTGREHALDCIGRLRRLRSQISAALPSASGDRVTALQQLEVRAAALEGIARRGRGGSAPANTDNGPWSFSRLQSDYATCFGLLEEADAEPTLTVEQTMQVITGNVGASNDAFDKLKKDASALNLSL